MPDILWDYQPEISADPLCGYGLNCLEGHCVLCKYIRRRAFFILTILEKKKH